MSVQKIIDYKVLYEDCAETLSQDVMAHLEEGYIPQGGVNICYSHDSDSEWYHQAIVKYESKMAEYESKMAEYELKKEIYNLNRKYLALKIMTLSFLDKNFEAKQKLINLITDKEMEELTSLPEEDINILFEQLNSFQKECH